MRYTFGKHERLSHKNIISELFSKGKSVTNYPLRLVYLPYEFDDESPGKVAFTVSKKKVKKAVDRNRIKRILREVYRKQKHEIYELNTQKYAMILMYLNSDQPSYNSLEKSFDVLLNKFKEREKQNL